MDIEQLHAEIYYQFAYTIALLEQGKKLSKKDISDISDKIYEIIVSRVELPVKPAKDGLMSDLEIAITRLIIDKANEIASGRKEASIEVGLLTQVVMPLVKELER